MKLFLYEVKNSDDERNFCCFYFLHTKTHTHKTYIIYS